MGCGSSNQNKTNKMKDCTYRLQYFPIAAAGEAIRLTFHAKSVAFTDERITFEEWPEVKKTLKNGQMPALYVDDMPPLVQSEAILRYLGRNFDMFPRDPMEAYLCDEVIATTGDIIKGLMTIFQICLFPGMYGHDDRTEEERKDVQAKLQANFLANSLPNCLKSLDSLVMQTGIMKNGKVTIGDTSIAARFRTMRTDCTMLTQNWPENAWADYPNLVAHDKKMQELEGIKKYFN